MVSVILKTLFYKFWVAGSSELWSQLTDGRFRNGSGRFLSRARLGATAMFWLHFFPALVVEGQSQRRVVRLDAVI